MASDWCAPIVIDAPDHVGGFTSGLAQVDGNPAIVYERGRELSDETVWDVAFARSSTSSGDNAMDWNQPVVLTSGLGDRFGPDLAVITGCPAITYVTDGSLLYQRALTSTGSASEDWGPTIVVSNNSCLRTASLDIIAGNPAIAFASKDHPAGGPYARQRYIRSSTDTGASASDWGPSVVVSSGETLYSEIAGTSLAEVNGNPAITYVRSSGSIELPDTAIKYTRSTNSTGELASDWIAPVVVLGLLHPGQTSSIAEIGGYPAIAFIRWTGFADEGGPGYCESSSSSGSTQSDWSQSPRAGDCSGYWCPLAEVNGNPAIAYSVYDNELEESRVAYSYFDG
jgi:hypothetical protein